MDNIDNTKNVEPLDPNLLNSNILEKKLSITSNIIPNIEISEISIAITDVVEYKDKLTSHYIYKFEVSEDGNIIQNERRFSDFLELRKQLLFFFPGIYIQIPHIKENIKSDKFIKERKFYLTSFLEYIKNRQFLYNSEPVTLFLKSKIKDIKKAFESYGNQNINEIYERFKIIEDVDTKTLEEYHFESNFEKIVNFKKVFDNNLTIFKQFASNIREYFNKKSDPKFIKNLTNFMEVFLNLKKNKYSNDKLIEVKENILEYSDILESDYLMKYYRIIEILILDLEAFNETYVEIEKYKLKFDNHSKKHIKLSNDYLNVYNSELTQIGKRNKQEVVEEYEKNIKDSEIELNQLKYILYIMFNRLYKFEIPILKKNKLMKFIEATEYFKGNYLNEIEKEENYWNSILSKIDDNN